MADILENRGGSMAKPIFFSRDRAAWPKTEAHAKNKDNLSSRNILSARRNRKARPLCGAKLCSGA